MTCNSFIGGLLYILTIYEKGKIRLDRIWRKGYIYSLIQSFEQMEKLINLLERTDDCICDLQPIVQYIQHYVGIELEAQMSDIKNCNLSSKLPYTTGDLQKINALMRYIIEKCKLLLQRKEQNYKKRIFFLLEALHNLPRIYQETTIVIGGIMIQPATIDDVIQWSSFYLVKADMV